MPSILDHHSKLTTKMINIGEPGTGKTGALAALVAAGYKVRLLDCDNGADTLLPLLTHPKYPYAKYMADHNIDVAQGLIYCTITERMKIDVNEKRPVPRTAAGFGKAMAMLENWKDGDINLGHIETWDTDCVLVIDTFGTLADLAFFNIQALNRRLGARREGFDFQRDVGGAQGVLIDLLKLLYDPAIKCNVIIMSHVTWVDESRGIADRPKSGENVLQEVKGFPSAIGRALSPVIGKYFNNVLYTSMSGSGASVRREIWTVPREGVRVKNSAAATLKPSYNVETALAEIFAALRGEPEPLDLIKACGRPSGPSASASARPVSAAAARPAPTAAVTAAP